MSVRTVPPSWALQTPLVFFSVLCPFWDLVLTPNGSAWHELHVNPVLTTPRWQVGIDSAREETE